MSNLSPRPAGEGDINLSPWDVLCHTLAQDIDNPHGYKSAWY